MILNSILKVFRFWMAMSHATSYGVYISQLILLARASSQVNDFNNRIITATCLKQGYRCHKLRKTFSKFDRRHSDLLSKYKVGLKAFLQDCLYEPEFYRTYSINSERVLAKLIFRAI